MIAAVLCIALGVGFEQVEIPDLYLVQYTVDFELEAGNFAHADINGDGQIDLVLPQRAYLRTNGRMDFDRSVAMPEVDSDSRADFWNGTLYLLSAAQLSMYRFEDVAWNQTLSLDHEWTLGERYRLEPEDKAPPIAFERFLYDIDADGQPEILRPDEREFAINSLKGGKISTSYLDIYPPARPSTYIGYNTLWPPSERRLALPTHRTLYDIVVDGAAATVLERVRHRGGIFTYRIRRYAIEQSPDGGFQAALLSDHETEPLPRHVIQAISLNDDGVIDFIGSKNDRPEIKDWKPLLQYFASTDGGNTFQTAVTRSFTPWPLFIDLDGDGDRDVIADESGLVSGGLMDAANRALSSSDITHTLLVRMQNADGAFDAKWRKFGEFTIQLDAPPRKLSFRFWQYRFGDLVDCTGDFNGDGWIDALVSDRPEQASVYLGSSNGFEKEAVATVAIPEDTEPTAMDVDGDGLDDIVAIWRDDHAPRSIYLNTGHVR